jgi:hypothetical protein
MLETVADEAIAMSEEEHFQLPGRTQTHSGFSLNTWQSGAVWELWCDRLLLVEEDGHSVIVNSGRY